MEKKMVVNWSCYLREVLINFRSSKIVDAQYIVTNGGLIILPKWANNNNISLKLFMSD